MQLFAEKTFRSVAETLHSIDEILKRLFANWEERFHESTAMNGEYPQTAFPPPEFKKLLNQADVPLRRFIELCPSTNSQRSSAMQSMPSAVESVRRSINGGSGTAG
jgi:hypothetical protein